MFSHALNKEGYPREGFLKGSRTNLECYDDRRLINHGSIKLRPQHYSNKSFQDHTFYIVETKTRKEIIVRHPASIRLGLVQVLCKNIAKHIAAVETKPKILSKIISSILMARYYIGSREANPSPTVTIQQVLQGGNPRRLNLRQISRSPQMTQV